MHISHTSTEASGRKVMTILSAAAFMNLTDTSVINIAMPSIREGFVGSGVDAEWVVVGYILAVAIGLLPFGRLGDIVGHKRLFLTGVGTFLIASLLCAFSPGPLWLIVGRVAQGLSCAMMVPQAPALSRILFSGEARGRALAMLSFVGGIASIFGPIVGGYLIGLDLWGSGWRSIFLLNLPFGLAALWFGLRYLFGISTCVSEMGLRFKESSGLV
jgi:MFS family permease